MTSSEQPIPVPWDQLIRCVRMGGSEQAVLDIRSGRLVFRMLTDDSWENDDVEHEVRTRPSDFIDLPHPSAREKAVWRRRYASQHADLASAPLNDPSKFEHALRKAKQLDEWQAFERRVIVELLLEWFERNGLVPATQPE